MGARSGLALQFSKGVCVCSFSWLDFDSWWRSAFAMTIEKVAGGGAEPTCER
jgi:hypothetical protein